MFIREKFLLNRPKPTVVKKHLFTVLVVLFSIAAKAQPGPTTYTLNPQPINGQYSTGTVVTMCFTMTGFGGCGTAEWFEGFDLNTPLDWKLLECLAQELPSIIPNPVRPSRKTD